MKLALFFVLASFAWPESPARERDAVIGQAVAEMQEHQPKRAIAALEPLAQARPMDYKALTLLGMALSEDGRYQDSIRALNDALKARPSYPPALKALATSEMNLQHFDLAKSHFEQLLKVTPNDPAGQAGLADIAFNRGQFGEAVRGFERSGSLYREDPRLLLEYAKANAQLGQTAKAADAIGGLADGADAAVHFEAGSLLAHLGRYGAAARQFELALPDYPDHYAAGFNLVLADLHAQRYKEAIDAGQRLMAAGYRKAELYNLLSEAYEKTGDTKQAYDALRTATQLEPADETNYIDLIALCTEHTNYDLAAEIAGIGLAKLPSSARLHVDFGVVLAMKAQLEQANKEFETAARLSPDRSLPYVAMALVSMQMNKPGDAVTRLRKRVRQFPKDYLSLWFLGEALNRTGIAAGSPEAKEAIESLERSVQLNPGISQSQELIGKLLAREGRLEEASVHLEKAIALDATNVGAIYQLAQVYSRKGDSARAKQLFARVSKMKTEDRENFLQHGFQQIVRADPQL